MLTKIILLGCAVLFLSSSNLQADTIYLKNGRTMEGFIRDENAEPILIDVGFGIIGLKRSEIESFSRSGEKDAQRLRDRWSRQRKESEDRNKEEKLKEQVALKNKREADDARKKQELNSKQVNISDESGHIIVTAFLNNKVNATFILDTGASLVVIKDNIARQLGINVSALKREVKLKVADGRESTAKYTVLSSVNVQGVEALNVDAAILSSDVQDPGLKDGLLGMAFLKNFNFKIDQRNQSLTLEKF
jgi:clan AA aspartic protease (TIGR02281 family)